MQIIDLKQNNFPTKTGTYLRKSKFSNRPDIVIINKIEKDNFGMFFICLNNTNFYLEESIKYNELWSDEIFVKYP